MKKFISDLLASLTNDGQGYSGKKLSAMVIVMCIVAAHIKWMTLKDFNTQLELVLTIDFSFILTIFGLNVADKKINTPTTPTDENPT